MIEAHELTKRYGDTTAVHTLSFTIAPGTVTGFLGPNSAGKSTTGDGRSTSVLSAVFSTMLAMTLRSPGRPEPSRAVLREFWRLIGSVRGDNRGKTERFIRPTLEEMSWLRRCFVV